MTPPRPHLAACCSCLASLAFAACGDPATIDDGDTWTDTGSADTSTDTSDDPTGTNTDPGTTLDTSDTDEPMMDMGLAPDMGPPPPDMPPVPLVPCANGSCWSTLTFSAICGSTLVEENYASGSFNVHEFEVSVWAERRVELSMIRTGGMLFPAIVILDELGDTVYDGEIGAWNEDLTINAIATGEDGEAASVEVTPHVDQILRVFVTGWDVIESDFMAPIPMDVTYEFEVYDECEPETGAGLPPNFDANDVVNGYYLLPPSEPPGLYERKGEACSRGTQRAIEVIYTVAQRWAELRPEFTPLQVRDINENINACGTDHMTHDDGTHFDLTTSCATEAACPNWVPAYDLARLFVDTGEVCGIIFNDVPIQDLTNPYFEISQAYEPWNQTFMRSVDGHDSHFHVRVKKLDGTCN